MPYEAKELHIRKVLNGWIVQAGCQTLVFSNAEHFINELSRWIKDPQATENEYMKAYGFPPPQPAPETMTMAQAITACETPTPIGADVRGVGPRR